MRRKENYDDVLLALQTCYSTSSVIRGGRSLPQITQLSKFHQLSLPVRWMGARMVEEAVVVRPTLYNRSFAAADAL